jgi:hypothetical protein
MDNVQNCDSYIIYYCPQKCINVLFLHEQVCNVAEEYQTF